MTRAELAPLVGRLVTAEATYTWHTLRRKQDDAPLHLVREVYVYPGLTLDHLWLRLPAKQVKGLKNEQRFSFRAQVDYYRRADGSRDVGLNVVRVLA